MILATSDTSTGEPSRTAVSGGATFTDLFVNAPGAGYTVRWWKNRPKPVETRVTLNEVSVSPLVPLLFGDTQLYIDRMTSIVRMRPASTESDTTP